jgi:hypothetical protein
MFFENRANILRNIEPKKILIKLRRSPSAAKATRFCWPYGRPEGRPLHNSDLIRVSLLAQPELQPGLRLSGHGLCKVLIPSALALSLVTNILWPSLARY